jgi:urease accessory protein
MLSTRRISIGLISGAVLASVFAAAPAVAHTGHPVHGLRDGVLHPLLGVDHLVAMVTVGILAVTMHRPLRVPAAFVGAMVLGGATGLAGMALPFGEAAIALSVVALGGALVAGHSIKTNPALALVAVAGFVHGHAHGLEVPAAANAAVYVVGFVLATVALHAAGVTLGSGLRDRAPTRALLGVVIAGVGAGLVAGVV